MKKLLTVLSICIATISAAQPGDRFMQAMKRNMAAFDTAFARTESLVNLSNSFERIAMAEKTQWLPYYYAAFCQVNYAFMEQDKSKTDAIADKADQLIRVADSLMPKHSEISCIRSMIASARLMVNPMQRYMQYGQESEQHLRNAMAQDSSNPRPYYLKGQALKYTPEQFGGGCKAAKEFLQTAIDKYAGFVPASELHPAWGKPQVERLMKECQ